MLFKYKMVFKNNSKFSLKLLPSSLSPEKPHSMSVTITITTAAVSLQTHRSPFVDDNTPHAFHDNIKIIVTLALHTDVNVQSNAQTVSAHYEPKIRNERNGMAIQPALVVSSNPTKKPSLHEATTLLRHNPPATDTGTRDQVSTSGTTADLKYRAEN